MTPDLKNWTKAYEALSGDMKGCQGATCPRSCCKEKNFGTILGTDEKLPYRTTLMEGEFEHLEASHPTLEELGVEVTLFAHESIVGQTVRLVKNCLGEHGCKLEPHGKKPMHCRIYPFGFKAMNGPSRECPAVQDILSQNGELSTQINTADDHLNFSPQLLAQIKKARDRINF